MDTHPKAHSELENPEAVNVHTGDVIKTIQSNYYQTTMDMHFF